jgi:DNA-directed RNA polymerase specialized sigma subunit
MFELLTKSDLTLEEEQLLLEHATESAGRGNYASEVESALLAYYEPLVWSALGQKLMALIDGEMLQDLVQEGRVVLLEQIRGYNPQYTPSPSEHFLQVLTKVLHRTWRTFKSSISASPIDLQKAAAIGALQAQDLSLEEVAAKLGVSLQEALELSNLGGFISLDTPQDDEGELCLKDVLAAPEESPLSSKSIVKTLLEILEITDPVLHRAVSNALENGYLSAPNRQRVRSVLSAEYPNLYQFRVMA